MKTSFLRIAYELLTFVVLAFNGILSFNQPIMKVSFAMSEKPVNTESVVNTESSNDSIVQNPIILDSREALREWYKNSDLSKNLTKESEFRNTIPCLENPKTKKIMILTSDYIDESIIDLLSEVVKFRVNNMDASSKLVQLNSDWIATIEAGKNPLVITSDGVKTYLLDFDSSEFKEYLSFWNMLDEKKPDSKSFLKEWDTIGKATRKTTKKTEKPQPIVKALPKF